MQTESVNKRAADSKSNSSSTSLYIQGQKYRWQLRQPNMPLIKKISNTHNISIPIAQVLFSRGYHDANQIREFLFSSYKQDVFDALLLKDAQTATDRILQAIKKKEKILIFGDYDVDGATSSSLVLLALIPLGARINYHLPNRARDGYGLSTKVVQQAAKNGYNLIITVDNGITAHEAAQRAAELGIDLIITDHHRQHDTLPEALAIINPNRIDCQYPFKSLAGVGVIFKLMHMIYEKKQLPLPEKVYELLLLGCEYSEAA